MGIKAAMLLQKRKVEKGSTTTNTQKTSNVPPEGGYGWICVVCTFLINAHTWGINSSYGVFLAYYLSSETFPGTTALEYAFVGGLSISCAMFVAPLSTYLARKIGTRFVLNTGTVLETLSLVTTSFVRTDWQLFLAQGVCFGLGMGFCFSGSVGVISYWFLRKRSFVNGIAAAGSGTGGLVYSLAAGKMIPQLGFPCAMRILGILCFTVNGICCNLLRLPAGSPHSISVDWSPGSTLRHSCVKKLQFSSFLVWAFLSVLGYVGLLFSLSSYTVAVGFTQEQASIASALLNLGQALGRPAIGLLSDRLGRIHVAFVSTFVAGLFCLVIWTFANSIGVIYFFAIVAGLNAGTIWASAAPLAAEVVGLQDLHTALAILWFTLGPPTAVAEAIAVQLRGNKTADRPYLRVQLFVGFIYLGAASFLILLKTSLSKGCGKPSQAEENRKTTSDEGSDRPQREL
ncbi:hypothetical protein CLAIMM_09803 [Cladophialophora immunda]|nr:hypothetical protein CLAIMM_09803 [Cladophialophora immunda]